MTVKTANLSIDGYPFVKRLGRSQGGVQDLRFIELKPSTLPYSGTFGALTAEARWLKMFEALLVAIKEDCGKAPSAFPQISAEQLDYSQHNTPQDPAYAQAQYSCS